MLVRLFQQRVHPTDIEANAASLIEQLRSAKIDGVDLLVAPEMALCRFDWSGIPHVCTRLGEAVNRIKHAVYASSVSLVYSTIHGAPGGQKSNRLWYVCARTRQIFPYDKIHLFEPLGEIGLLTAGETPLLCDIQGAQESIQAGFSVCYDLRFPELYRFEKRLGASCFIVIAGWPSERIDVWRLLLRARAAENQVPVIAVNRCGPETFKGDEVEFGGHSAVIGPDGSVLSELAGDSGSIDYRFERPKPPPFNTDKGRRDDLYSQWYRQRFEVK